MKLGQPTERTQARPIRRSALKTSVDETPSSKASPLRAEREMEMKRREREEEDVEVLFPEDDAELLRLEILVIGNFNFTLVSSQISPSDVDCQVSALFQTALTTIQILKMRNQRCGI